MWAPPPPVPGSAGTLEDDPLITRIATILSSQPHGGELLGGGGGSGSGSGLTPRASRIASSSSLSSPLAPDFGHWAVRWGEIKVQRPVGRGSFGRVYQATWNATPVAVKVLIRSGAHTPADAQLLETLPEGADQTCPLLFVSCAAALSP